MFQNIFELKKIINAKFLNKKKPCCVTYVNWKSNPMKFLGFAGNFVSKLKNFSSEKKTDFMKIFKYPFEWIFMPNHVFYYFHKVFCFCFNAIVDLKLFN